MKILILSALLAAATTPLAPSAVLASAASLDNTTITVSGTVGEYAVVHAAFKGTFTKFQLCNTTGTPCIGVVEKGDAHLGKGQAATVTGKFHVNFSLYGKKGTNVVGVGV